MEQVVQKFQARPSNPEPQVGTTEVGAAGKARERSERSVEDVADRRTDDDVKSCRSTAAFFSSSITTCHGLFPKCSASENIVQFFGSSSRSVARQYG